MRGCRLKILLISIHAFRVEGDTARRFLTHRLQYFNPRLPCGRRPVHSSRPLDPLLYFNPRLPCGRRPYIVRITANDGVFQSTPSVWKATPSCLYTVSDIRISIHAFRVEGDYSAKLNKYAVADFNPRLPCGRRRNTVTVQIWCSLISIHAFRVEGDCRFLSKIANLW